MVTAEELLTAEGCDDILTVDLESRIIKIPNTVQNLGVESDENVRILHFVVPRHYCEIDLSTFAIRVNYKNTSGAGGTYDIVNPSIESDKIKFDWIVDRSVTVRRGNVVFNVCFREIVNDIVEREFNTTIATLPVLEGLETGEEIVSEHLDVFEQLLSRFDEFQPDGCSGINLTNEASVGQTIVVSEIDENGKPTEWEAADMVRGLDNTEKKLLLALFKNAAYTADMSVTIAQLEALWSESGEDDGSGDTSDDAESGVSQVGSVLIIASGVTATQSGSVLTIA